MLFFVHLLIISTFSAAFASNSDRVFIIAAHNEDLKWLEPIASETIIYNKGRPIADEELAGKFLDVRTLPNVGRESHTYLTYVVDNYDNLPDVITFSQARISDHGHHQPLEFLLRISEEARQFGGSKNFSNSYIPNISARHIISHLYPVLPDDRFKDYQSFMIHYFGKYEPHQKVYWNGIFSVRKDKILRRSKEFYESLIEAIDYHNGL